MLPDDALPGRVEPDVPHGRLDSWKEIAAYLRRDIKTVQRWERREHLPVHRLHHDKQGSVYAYRDELARWMAQRSVPGEAPDERQTAPVPHGVTAGSAPSTTGGPPVAGSPHAGSHVARLVDDGATGGTATPGRAQHHAASPIDEQTSASRPRRHAARDSRRSLRPALTLGLVAVACACTLALLWALGRLEHHGTAPTAPVRFLVAPPPGTAFAGNIVDPEPVVSPDGTRIVFRAADQGTGRQRLYLRRLDRPEAGPIAGTEQGVQPFWSPDSKQVGFFGNGELRRIDLASGIVTALAPAPEPQGGAWLTSGDIVYSPSAGVGLQVLRAGGGPPVVVTKIDRASGQVRHVAPQPVPDGQRFVYLATYQDARQTAVFLSGPSTGGDRRIAAVPRMGRVVDGRWFVYFHGRQLVARPLDLNAAALGGHPVDLGEALEADDVHNPRTGFSLSSGGTLAYWPITRTSTTRLTWFDRQGRQTGTVGPPGDYPFVALSPEGFHVAAQRLDEAVAAPDIWLFELHGGGAATRLTTAPVNEEDPVWSPDGTELVFAKHPAIGAGAELRRLRPARPMWEDPVTPRVEGHPTDWSRDGRHIVFQRRLPGTLDDIYALPVSGGLPVALVTSPFNERHGRLSPDGRFVAYSSDASGRLEVYVKDVAADGGTTQVSNTGGAHPRWRRDGRELFYVSAGGVITAVATTLTPAFTAGPPTPLFDARPALPLVFLDTLYDVTADGQRFLVASTEHPATTSFTVVLNGLTALGR